jgi:hypothetical protein
MVLFSYYQTSVLLLWQLSEEGQGPPIRYVIE